MLQDIIQASKDLARHNRIELGDALVGNQVHTIKATTEDPHQKKQGRPVEPLGGMFVAQRKRLTQRASSLNPEFIAHVRVNTRCQRAKSIASDAPSVSAEFACLELAFQE